MRRARGIASPIDPHAGLLEAGQNVAFGAAAVVGVIAVGASLFNQTTPPITDAPPAPAPRYAAPQIEAEELAVVEDAVFEPDSSTWEIATATPVVFNVPANMLPMLEPVAPLAPSMEPNLASAVSFQDDALRLTQPSLFSRSEDEATLDSGARVHAPASTRERLDAMAADLTYQAPADQSQDIALFVAADDEAVSWALNSSSPNFGGVAYEEGRVEVGDLSAGVALTTDDVRIAAAYVERDMDMRLGRGFENQDQRYAGVIVTLKN